jgi:hypothetical protein
MNKYFVVIVRSDRTVRGWIEEPWVYGRFNSERQAEAWATYNQIVARSRGDMYEYVISRLQTPTGVGLALRG